MKKLKAKLRRWGYKFRLAVLGMHQARITHPDGMQIVIVNDDTDAVISQLGVTEERGMELQQAMIEEVSKGQKHVTAIASEVTSGCKHQNEVATLGMMMGAHTAMLSPQYRIMEMLKHMKDK